MIIIHQLKGKKTLDVNHLTSLTSNLHISKIRKLEPPEIFWTLKMDKIKIQYNDKICGFFREKGAKFQTLICCKHGQGSRKWAWNALVTNKTFQSPVSKIYVTWSCHKAFQIAHQEGHVHSTRGGKKSVQPVIKKYVLPPPKMCNDLKQMLLHNYIWT